MFYKSILACSLLSIAGCSEQPRSEVFDTVSAGGTLTYQGKPLAGYLVSFQPADASRTATGVTSAEGKFVLGTNEPEDGAVPGMHSVSVVWQPPEDDGTGSIMDDPTKMPKAPIELPAKYASASTSGIQIEIPSGGKSDIVVELQ